MKKQLLYGAAVAMILAACSNNETEGPDNTVQPRNAVPIHIGQNVEGMTARAVVENGSSVTATVLTATYSSDYAATAWNNFTPQYADELNSPDNTLTTPANVSTATFTAGANQTVNLNPVLYYYPSDGTAVTAIAPAGTVSGNNVVMQMQDGEQDVMVATVQTVDSKPDTQEAADNNPVTLTFAHKTTQLNFAFQLSSTPSDAWKDKTISVKSITIQKASVPVSVSFPDGTVTFKAPGENLNVPGIITGNIISTKAQKVGRPVMVNVSNDIKLNVTLTVGGKDYTFSNVQVMKNGGTNEKLATVIGDSHLVTLTVTEPVRPSDGVGITTQANVTPWNHGQEGSGELK